MRCLPSLLACLIIGAGNLQAQVVVDNFDTPSPAQGLGVIGTGSPGVVSIPGQGTFSGVVSTGTFANAGLGGERDVIVLETFNGGIQPAPTTHTGGASVIVGNSFGNGIFAFNTLTDQFTSPSGKLAAIVYNGPDANNTPNDPFDDPGLGLDLASQGSFFQLDFAFVGDNFDDAFPFFLSLVDGAGRVATFEGSLSPSDTAFSVVIPFGSFTTDPGFDFGDVDTIAVGFITPNAGFLGNPPAPGNISQQADDLVLSQISVVGPPFDPGVGDVIPEPGTLALWGIVVGGMGVARYRRKKRISAA